MLLNSAERLGANIRSLRIAFGETLEQLGYIIGEKSTSSMSYYESGERIIKKESLNAIAKHFGVTTDELLYGDYSSEDKVKLKYKKGNNIRALAWLYPTVSSESALKNEWFRRALDAQREILIRSSKFESCPINELEKCFDAYEMSIEDSEAVFETKANLISLMMMFLSALTIPVNTITNNAVCELIKQADRRIDQLLEDAFEIPEEEDAEKREVIIEADKEIMQYISDLKKSPDWSELADYFLALRYILCTVDNDLSREFNQRIGFELLEAFKAVGNSYAIRGLRNIFSIFET